MVVVGVGPARGVDLACRYAYRAQSCHCESRLLAAASYGRAYCGQRGACAAVRGLIGDFFVTPVVDLEHGVGHGETFDAVFELVVKHHAAIVEILVVDAHRQYEVVKLAVGYFSSPGHFLTGSECCPDVIEIEAGAVVGDVGQRHVGVEKLHGVALGSRHGWHGQIAGRDRVG